MALLPLSIQTLVQKAALASQVDTALLCAMVATESNGRPFVSRYEPKWNSFVQPDRFAKSLATTLETETMQQATSWGLCIEENEPVLTTSGWKPIRDMEPGEHVINRQGRPDRVLAKLASGEKECLEIAVGLSGDLRLTANHPVWARKATISRRTSGKRRIIVAEKPEFIPAGELSEWDLIGYPVEHHVHDINEIDLLPMIEKPDGWKNAIEYRIEGDFITVSYKGGRERYRTKRRIAVDRDLLELLGLYTAEGHRLEKDKGVGFAFHEKETHLHSRVVELCDRVFGTRHNTSTGGHGRGVQIFVYGAGPACLAKLVQHTQPERILPSWALWLPPEKQRWLFLGAFLGDGSKKFAKITTASLALAHSWLHILQRLGIVGRLARVESKGHVWYDIGLNSHAAVSSLNSQLGNIAEWAQTSALGLRRQNATHWKADRDFVYFPVRSIQSIGSRPTYDLQIESDSTFCVRRSIVHNCQIVGASARELGFKGLFPELCQPELGLAFGIYKLKHLETMYAGAAEVVLSWNEAVVASYNHGHPEKGSDGKWVNQTYVDRVRSAYLTFGGKP